MSKRVFNFIRKNRLLLLITIFAVLLRVIAINKLPPSLNWDEISHGYNAYSILKTGKDEWGKTLPIIFRAYGDQKLPLYIYLTALSEVFLGLNELAVRLPSIVGGVLTVIFTFLLTRKLFNQKVALLSALLVSIEPWSLFLSRAAFEANLSLTLIVAGVYFFVSSFEKPKRLVLSTFLFGLSVWTYNSARVFVPLLIISLGLIYKEKLMHIWKKNKFYTATSLFMILFFLLPMFWQLANSIGQARYSEVAIIDQGAIAQINEARGDSNFSPLMARALHNKVTYFTVNFAKRWFSYFSPQYLFTKGGTHFQFSLPDHGLIYLVNFPFIIIGLIYLLKRKDKTSLLLLGWLFLAPIPASLTRDTNHVLRSITFLPIPMILTALGYEQIINSLKKKSKNYFAILYFLILSLFFANYAKRYTTDYPKNYSWSWQYGYKEVAGYVEKDYAKYDKIIVSKKYGEPHEFFLFYLSWDPEQYMKDPNLKRFFQSNWYWVDRFDKFYFVNDWDLPKDDKDEFILESGEEFNCNGQNCLLVTGPDNFPKSWKKLETINFKDGKAAFGIFTNK